MTAPAIGIAVVWHDDDDREVGSALLEPGAALSLANTLLAAVAAVLGVSNTYRAVAEILRDVDPELAALLDGGQG